MTIDKEAWLARTVEEPQEPGLPICDAHHHLWDRPGNRYMPDDLLKDIGGHNVVSTVFIDCHSSYRRSGPEEMRPLGETEFVRAIAEAHAGKKTAVAAGIVGFANLTLGKNIERVLDAHLATGGGYFKGIRHSTARDPNPEIDAYMNSPKGLMLAPVFQEGFAFLKKYGLSYDAWLYFHQMPELAVLARAFPETVIICDHVGGLVLTNQYANNRDQVIQQWKKNIAELGECPNVYMKLGGLGMPRCGFGWHDRVNPPGSEELAKAMAPYFNWCIERFGLNRCMLESNFPVDKASYSYSVMWNAFKRYCTGFSKTEKAALFHDTAVRAYRLTTG
jgi:predicted TIM-barrel fold metal-dependent hydrolase